MRVIGVALVENSHSKPNVIVEMTHEEFRLLKYARSTVGYNDTFAVGHEIEIHSKFQRLLQLESNRSHLDQAIGVLRSCANSLVPLGQFVTCEPSPTPEIAQEGGGSHG